MCFCFTTLPAQRLPKLVDSLLIEAKKAPDSSRLRILNRVSFYFIFNDAPRADSLITDALNEARTKKALFSISELTNTYGILKDVSGQSDSAGYYFKRSLQHSQEHGHKTVTVMVINNLGMYNWNKGNYDEALKYFFDALEMNKDNSTDVGDGIYLNNIGLIYQEMELNDKALEYHRKALAIRRKHELMSEIPASLNNIAICLRSKGELDQAFESAQEANQIAAANKMDQLYYETLSTIGNIYMSQENYSEAIPRMREIIAGRDEKNINRRSNIGVITNLISAYNNIGNLNQAKQIVVLGEKYVEEFPEYTNNLSAYYLAAAQTAFIENKVKKGQGLVKQSERVKDSIFSLENAQKMASLETQFKVAQNERDLAQTRATLAESELQVKKKNSLIYGALGLAAILGLLGYLFYSRQRLKNRQMAKEAELKTALAKIETQNKLQEQRLRISRDLHDNIGSQLTFVTSSVDNLSFGLKDKDPAVTNKLAGISDFTKDTIHELRDTIWAMNQNQISIEDLQVRISNFIEKASSATAAIKFKFDVSKEVPNDLILSSVQGMNLYRIIQEGVNNALKYAKAEQISVHIDWQNKQLITTINDNGIGFDPASTPMGNGISNIKKRTSDLGGTVKVDSTSGQGTTISLHCPVA
ncbi:MAG: tetratricopeptide repeat protein [Gilvibacter sp.]